MTRVRYEDEPSSRGLLYLSIGVASGLAAGLLLSGKFGGVRGIADALRGVFEDGDEADDREADDIDVELEERVLEAFRNDPILSERAVDIGAIGDGIIELTGWVHSEDEANHASTLARGVPDVETVVNRLAVRDDADELAEQEARRSSGVHVVPEDLDDGDGDGAVRAD